MKFKGELHQVKLINFSVEKEELNGLLPKELKLFDYHGRALISMVDVHLKNMKMTSFMPSFSYRHLAFRVLVDDTEFNQEEPKGIYFLQSFSSNPLMVVGGNMIANYQLNLAKIESSFNTLKIQQKDKFLHYALSGSDAVKNEDLFTVIKRIDRAYAAKNNKVEVTRITRKEWPIKPVSLLNFETNYFKTARLEGAFEVGKVIHYVWEKPELVQRKLL